jgi:hypothetical protein
MIKILLYCQLMLIMINHYLIRKYNLIKLIEKKINFLIKEI